MENCPFCEQELYGELEVVSMTISGVDVTAVQEKSKRNWIICDSCNVLICHNCANHPETGYCNDCIKEFNIQV